MTAQASIRYHVERAATAKTKRERKTHRRLARKIELLNRICEERRGL